MKPKKKAAKLPSTDRPKPKKADENCEADQEEEMLSQLKGFRYIQWLQQNVGSRPHGEDSAAVWFCSWPDSYYALFKISKTEREVLRLLADGLSMEKLLLGCLGLMLNPGRPPSFWSRRMFFNMFEEAFRSSHSWLRRLYTNPETGKSEQDAEISGWAGGILAEHYAEVVRGWIQWGGCIEKGKGDECIAAGNSDFLTRAMAGRTENRKGEIKSVSPLPADWFRKRMDKLIEAHSTAFMMPFVLHCLNWAMFFPEPPQAKARRAINDDYQRRFRQAMSEGRELPTPTQEELSAMKWDRLSDDLQEFERMTEEQFSYAWDRDGMSARTLRAHIQMLRSTGKGGLGRDGAMRGQLPIKGIMQEELPFLQQLCEENQSLRNGKNGATYLSWKQTDLLRLLRPLFGLPRDKPPLRSKRQVKL
jgi:hypothetical protein